MVGPAGVQKSNSANGLQRLTRQNADIERKSLLLRVANARSRTWSSKVVGDIYVALGERDGQCALAIGPASVASGLIIEDAAIALPVFRLHEFISELVRLEAFASDIASAVANPVATRSKGKGTMTLAERRSMELPAGNTGRA